MGWGYLRVGCAGPQAPASHPLLPTRGPRMGSWRCTLLPLCVSGSSGLVKGRGTEGAGPWHQPGPEREELDRSVGPVPFLTQCLSVPRSQTCWGSRVRDGRLRGHCQAPGAKAGRDLPSAGLPPQFPASPMPAAGRSGPARRRDRCGAGGACCLVLMASGSGGDGSPVGGVALSWGVLTPLWAGASPPLL